MQNNLQGKLTDEEIERMIKIDPQLELVTKKISIDLNQHSYHSTYSNCLPSCCVMAFCYWQENLPQLNITLSRDYWEEFINKCSAGTIKGVNLQKVIMNLQPEYRKFIFSERCLTSFSDLIPPFYAGRIPIIQIITFDRMYAFRERSGGTHAAIVSQVNMQEKNLLLIDPMESNEEKVIIESRFPMREFAKGWKLLLYSVIWIYPKILKPSFDIKIGKPAISKKLKQDNLNKFIEL